MNSQLRIRACRGPAEFPELVEVWRSAVRATHDFLDESDFRRIEANLPSEYFPAVRLIIAERNNQTVGFAGVVEGSLEMLFVADSARGEGVGTALLTESIAHHGVDRVEVNEQNVEACGFYLSRGFVQVGRSELDGDGRPYPILQLEMPATAQR